MFQPSKYLRSFRNFSKILSNTYLSIDRTCSTNSSKTFTPDVIKTSGPGGFSPYLFGLNNNKEISLPTLSYSPKMDPTILGIFEKIEQMPFLIPYEEPKKEISKQAARLIVIRRKKMKKHKLLKLRVKMKFEWAKKRQRKELTKEKLFQDEMLAQMEEAKKFDAAGYVSEKLAKAKEVPLPRTIKGKRLPAFLIKQILEKKNKISKD